MGADDGVQYRGLSLGRDIAVSASRTRTLVSMPAFVFGLDEQLHRTIFI